MPVIPNTYLDLQIQFQDNYEASVKTLGLDNWVLSSDIILNYLYKSELNILHELALNKRYDLLRGYTINEDVSGGLTLQTDGTVKTAVVECNYYLRSYSTIISTYPSAYQSTGIVENELILPEDAVLYYKSAFNIPYFKNPKIYIDPVNSYVTPETSENIFVIIPDGYTVITGLHLTYIKIPPKPTELSYCFSDHTLYNKIVETAVNSAISDLVKLSSPKNKEAI